MPRKRRFAQLRSASIRFALIYAGLLALNTMALAAFLWWSTAGLLDRQTDAAIRADAQGLSERWAEGGLPALISTIDDRLAQNLDDDAIYLVADAQMQRVVGNLPFWPQGVNEQGVPYSLEVARAGTRSLARVQRFDLPGNASLLVGRDVRARSQLRALLTDGMVWASLVVALMAAAGGLLVRSLFRRTIANVSETAAAIAAGDLMRRVHLSGRGDEFDQLAETINDMLDRIARLMDGVRQVSNSIAHDLRTPITRARARLEDAALHATGADALRAAIEQATQDLDGIIAVFRALMRIAEIEAGSRRSAFARFDVSALMDDLAEFYTVGAEEREMTVDYNRAPSLFIHGDRAMVQLAVANLLDNAMKFSPVGSVIGLDVRPDGKMLAISVTDQGSGIAAEDRPRAVERFFRGEAARHTAGSGLGLALVHAVAKLHGGELSLGDARPGTAPPGLRATLHLPMEQDGENRLSGAES
jgi:signal transduction histidine kinase